MKYRLSILSLLLAFTSVFGVDLSVENVKGKVNQFIRVKAVTTGKVVQWVAVDPELNLFPVELLKDTKTAVVVASSPGKYRLIAYTAEGDVPSLPVTATIDVEGTTPPVPPPGPTPDPTPPQPPTPPLPPAPIPVAGLRVLIVYDATKETELPVSQQAIIRGKKMDDYLNAKCAIGPDGKTREFRMWPATTVLTDDVPPLWVEAMKREKKSFPWLMVSDGKTGYEGPLPQTVDQTIAIIDKVIAATEYKTRAKGDK